MIEALYCGDENRMKKELLSLYSLYSDVDNDVYNIFELKELDAAALDALGFGADELTAYLDRVRAVMGEMNWYSEDNPNAGFYVLEHEAEVVREIEAARSSTGTGSN